MGVPATLDRLSLWAFRALQRLGCVGVAGLVGLLLAGGCVSAAARAHAGDVGATSCALALEPACSPLVEDKATCYDDSTRWVRLRVEGACRLPDAEWTAEPVAHKGEASVWAWHRDGLAYVRGHCGVYRVTAHAGDQTLEIDVELPGPLCDDRRPPTDGAAPPDTASLGPQCPGQSGTWVTVGQLREATLELPDGARVAVLVDGKVARLATVVAPGCWAPSMSREYGLEHCSRDQPADTLVLY